MNSNSRTPKMKKKMLLVVLQLLEITTVESRPSSGLFAVVRRTNDSAEDNRTPSLFRRHRRRSIPDCSIAEDVGEAEESEYDCNHDTVLPSDDRNFQDSTPECTGRFAMEYEIERKMMRSAENPHIQRHLYGDSADDETINNNAHRIINPATMFRSEPAEPDTRQRRDTFSYQIDGTIFV